ncbi:MAG TPA: NUDIX hydrolase [Chloroflexota bacterium]|jgi:ADP-ribose pyrophosphatase|nr:NUDIX hydrolase [Chloroflexota bacterium]
MSGPPGAPSGGWKRLRATLLLDRRPWLQVYADDVELPDGRRVDGFLRIEARPYATVFAVTPDGQAVFLRQYKYGPDRVALQLPAGYLEADEAPAAGARRELLEETGYAAGRLESLGAYRPDGNRGFGCGHFFLARDARYVQAPSSDDLEEPAVELIPLADCEARMTSGEMVELAPIACVALALARLKA